MTQGAFIAWQMGSGGSVTFGEYLENLGIKDSEKEEPGPPITKDEAIARAEKIHQAIQRSKGK